MHGFNALFNWLNIKINLIQVYIQIMFTGMSCLQIGSTAHTIGPNILLQNVYICCQEHNLSASMAMAPILKI